MAEGEHQNELVGCGVNKRSSVARVARVGGLGIAVGLSLFTASIGHAAPQSSAARLLHAALADAAARGSVHETVSQVLNGQRATYSDDVANRFGRQDITVSNGSRAHVVVSGHVAYISGNHQALITYFGLPRSAARVIGDRWVSIPASSRAYATVSEAATLPSALADMTPSGQLTELRPTKIGGESVIGIRGGLPRSLTQASPGDFAGTATIYVTRSRHPLPVHATLTLSRGIRPVGRVVSTLSHWGELEAIRPPVNTIPITRLPL